MGLPIRRVGGRVFNAQVSAGQKIRFSLKQPGKEDYP